MKKLIILVIMFSCFFFLIPSAKAEPSLHLITSSDGDNAVQMYVLLDPTEGTVCYFPITRYANTPTCLSTTNTRFGRTPILRLLIQTGEERDVFQIYRLIDHDGNNVCYVTNIRGANTPFCMSRSRR